MKTEMTVNGISVCPTAEERHEYFTLALSPRRKKRLCQYDYRDADGELFSCVAPTLEECRAKRDIWLNNKNNKLEKPRDFDPFGHAGLPPLATI